MHIRTRDNLIEWLETNAPRPCIKRVLIHGTNENFGGFSKIPRTPFKHGGWIIKVIGKAQEWIVAVKPRLLEGYTAYVLDEIPWEYWEGDESENPLYQGDHPEVYGSIKIISIRNKIDKVVE